MRRATLFILLLGVCSQTAASGPLATPPGRIVASGITGALVICGGGKLPEEAARRFMKLAGGESARLVVIPTASAEADQGKGESFLASWRKRKPASVVLLHTRSREQAGTEAFVKPLLEATGVWVSGGNQSRIAAAYLDTAVELSLIHI